MVLLLLLLGVSYVAVAATVVDTVVFASVAVADVGDVAALASDAFGVVLLLLLLLLLLMMMWMLLLLVLREERRTPRRKRHVRFMQRCFCL